MGDDKKKSNCLFWAVKQWLKYGGYLVIRRSKHYFGLHFLWVEKEGEKFKHYHPRELFYGGRRLKWWEAVKLIRFEGIVKTGDEK